MTVHKGFRDQLEMPPAEGGAPGTKAIFRLKMGFDYHEFQLSYSGCKLGDLGQLRILANGDDIHRYPATVRDSLNQFDGLAAVDPNATAGTLVIPTNRRGMKDRANEEFVSLNTNSFDANGRGIKTLLIEVPIAGTLGAAPVLTLNATCGVSKPGGPGTIMRVLSENFFASGAGDRDIVPSVFGSPQTAVINRLFFKSANITKMTLKRDRVERFQRTKALNDFMQAKGVRKPQAGWYAIDFTELGYGDEVLPVANVADLRYIANMSAQDSIDYYTEWLGTL